MITNPLIGKILWVIVLVCIVNTDAAWSDEKFIEKYKKSQLVTGESLLEKPSFFKKKTLILVGEFAKDGRGKPTEYFVTYGAICHVTGDTQGALEISGKITLAASFLGGVDKKKVFVFSNKGGNYEELLEVLLDKKTVVIFSPSEGGGYKDVLKLEYLGHVQGDVTQKLQP